MGSAVRRASLSRGNDIRTKNARAHDNIEAVYLADVKRCACVVCGAPPITDAHHPEQGLHLIACALCKECHGGPGYPHGWHGDKSRWRAAKMTELRAINETRRRVDELRAGIASSLTIKPMRVQRKPARVRGSLSSDKCLPRRGF